MLAATTVTVRWPQQAAMGTRTSPSATGANCSPLTRACCAVRRASGSHALGSSDTQATSDVYATNAAHESAMREARARDLRHLAELLAREQGPQSSLQQMSRTERIRLKKTFAAAGLDLNTLISEAQARQKNARSGKQGSADGDAVVIWYGPN